MLMNELVVHAKIKSLDELDYYAEISLHFELDQLVGFSKWCLYLIGLRWASIWLDEVLQHQLENPNKNIPSRDIFIDRSTSRLNSYQII